MEKDKKMVKDIDELTKNNSDALNMEDLTEEVEKFLSPGIGKPPSISVPIMSTPPYSPTDESKSNLKNSVRFAEALSRRNFFSYS